MTTKTMHKHAAHEPVVHKPAIVAPPSALETMLTRLTIDVQAMQASGEQIAPARLTPIKDALAKALEEAKR